VQVFVRDVEHVLMRLLMILMYLTPILYPLSLVPEHCSSGSAQSVRLAGRAASRALLDGRLALEWGDASRSSSRWLSSRRAWVFRRLSPHFEDFV
jgi:hypothetical protein